MISLDSYSEHQGQGNHGAANPCAYGAARSGSGGGCSGFQYHMAFENQTNDTDEVVDFNGLKVAVDQMSSMYLEGVEMTTSKRLKARASSSTIRT